MAFNAESFLATTVSQELSTRSEPCPEGTYPAQVLKVEARDVDTKRGAAVVLRLTWSILDDYVKSTLGRDVITVSQDIWIDFNADGEFATGKGQNIKLGRVREAVGQNGPEAWSPPMLEMQMAQVYVSHRSDANDPSIKYAEVTRVAKLN